jgi:hypothetical protein
MDRLRGVLKAIGIWVFMILPWGRDKMLKEAFRRGHERGQYMFAQRLANLNRQQRRMAIRHLVKNFKKT